MRKITITFITLIVCLLLGGCQAAPDQEVSFTVLDEGDTASEFPKQQGVALSTAAEWRTLWTRVHATRIPPLEMPAVDLQETVLAVFAGERRSGGSVIRVERIVQTEAQVIVHVKITEPAPGASLITMMTYPYQIVKARLKPGLPIQFSFTGGSSK